MHLPIQKVPLIAPLIMIPKNPLATPNSLLKLPLVIRLILEYLLTPSMLLPIRPGPLIPPPLSLTHIHPMPMRQPQLPLALVEIPALAHKHPLAVHKPVMPLPLVVHPIQEHHQSEPITFLVDQLAHVAAHLVLDQLEFADVAVVVAESGAGFLDLGVVADEDWVRGGYFGACRCLVIGSGWFVLRIWRRSIADCPFLKYIGYIYGLLWIFLE